MTAVTEQIEADVESVNLAQVDLAALVAEHQADIWRYLRYLGAESADADDLTQETFLAFHRATFAERSPVETAAYLRTVARNQLLMFRRFQGREIDTVELEAAEQVWAETVERASMSGILETLADCLKAVDGRAREAINLFYREGLSRKAMAAAMEIKPEGVKTLLRRTRDVLRDCIERKTKNS